MTSSAHGRGKKLFSPRRDEFFLDKDGFESTKKALAHDKGTASGAWIVVFEREAERHLSKGGILGLRREAACGAGLWIWRGGR